MARRLTTSRRAIRQLDAARAWLTQSGSGERGLRRWRDLSASLQRLVSFPLLGVRSAADPRYRVLTVQEHRIFYILEPDASTPEEVRRVRIMAVFGPGQDEAV